MIYKKPIQHLGDQLRRRMPVERDVPPRLAELLAAIDAAEQADACGRETREWDGPGASDRADEQKKG